MLELRHYFKPKTVSKTVIYLNFYSYLFTRIHQQQQQQHRRETYTSQRYSHDAKGLFWFHCLRVTEVRWELLQTCGIWDHAQGYPDYKQNFSALKPNNFLTQITISWFGKAIAQIISTIFGTFKTHTELNNFDNCQPDHNRELQQV